MNRTVKVACINWSYPDAPHATAYVLEDGRNIARWYFNTHAEAINWATTVARELRGAA